MFLASFVDLLELPDRSQFALFQFRPLPVTDAREALIADLAQTSPPPSLLKVFFGHPLHSLSHRPLPSFSYPSFPAFASLSHNLICRLFFSNSTPFSRESLSARFLRSPPWTWYRVCVNSVKTFLAFAPRQLSSANYPCFHNLSRRDCSASPQLIPRWGLF